MSRRALAAIGVASLAVAWAGWLIATPMVAAASPSRAALVAVAATYRAGSLVCHQHADRSFHIGDVQTPVCARCVGLYGGAAIGAIIGLSWMRRRSCLAARAPGAAPALGWQAGAPGAAPALGWQAGAPDAAPALGWHAGRPARNGWASVGIGTLRKVLLGAAVPTVVLWAIEHIVALDVSNAVRCAGAVPLGAAVAGFVVAWVAGAPFDDNPPDCAIH